DLLVFNRSRTIPAALRGRSGATGIELRLAERLEDGSWLALLLCEAGEPFACGLAAGMEIEFGSELRAVVRDRDARIPRLWRVELSRTGPELIEALYRLGQPVRYEYVSSPWEIDDYQTVYATDPGSSEMPSAGRAFTWRMLFDLKRAGVETASLVLHTTLSSYMDDAVDAAHAASEEAYAVDAETAERVHAARGRGNRVVAVGTTVVRALEAAADDAGTVRAGRGYTRLHIDAARRLRAVDA